MTIKYGNTVAETGIGVYPHAFMKYVKGSFVEVYFRTKFICKYPINNILKSNLTNIILNDEHKTEFYVKDSKVYSYSHVKEETKLVLDNVA